LADFPTFPTVPAAWERQIRQEAKDVLGTGFFIAGDKTGSVRLQQRQTDKNGKTKTISLKLPYKWKETSVIDICSRLRVIGKALSAGKDLKSAALAAEGLSSHAQVDWKAMVEGFEQHLKTTGVGISDRTWRSDHVKPMRLALTELVILKTQTADELIAAVARNYKLGSVSRNKAVASVSRFLRYGIKHHHLNPVRWTPRVELEEVRGRRIPKREQYPFTDEQIIRLVDAMQAHPKKVTQRYVWMIQLMATYGLRPIEVFYLSLRSNGELWCDYRKRAGGGDTKPRKLRPIPVIDNTGKPAAWNVEDRLRLGEEKPNIVRNHAGTRLGEFLNDLEIPTWREICEEAEADGYKAVPYGFRHRYSRAAHAAGIPAKHIADSMGHSLQVHLSTYAAFDSSREADAAFDRAFSNLSRS